MSEQTGAHRLGPHVVGQRVVVRRLLRGQRGPSGGPALTDVLGVCTSWADGTCVVQPESGPPVVIAVADIVSGKPVPPRPSVRGRVSPYDAHLRAGALFDDLVTEPLGGWLLRRSERHPARRANSVLALGPSGLDGGVLGGVDGGVGRVREWYDAAGRRPIAVVLPHSAEEAEFRSRGWVLERDLADTAFQLAGVAAAARAAASSPPPAGTTPAVVTLLETGPGQARAEAPGVASGLAARADDWVGLRAIEVDPAHRGRGLARAVVAALLGWGAEQGARTAYLQVTSDNAPALRLYEGLGFVTHHEYRYLTPA